MTTVSAQPNTYPVSFTAASLRPELARIVAQAYLDSADWKLAKALVRKNNLLQARSPASGHRMEQEMRLRLQKLTCRELEILAQATSDARQAIAWLAALKHAPIIYAFAVEVLRTKLEHLDPVLRPSDYEGFWELEVTRHPELARLTPSTKVKIRSVIMTMVREAGIMQAGDSLVFNRPVLPPDVLDAIVSDEPKWLAGFLVPDDEIKALMR